MSTTILMAQRNEVLASSMQPSEGTQEGTPLQQVTSTVGQQSLPKETPTSPESTPTISIDMPTVSSSSSQSIVQKEIGGAVPISIVKGGLKEGLKQFEPVPVKYERVYIPSDKRFFVECEGGGLKIPDFVDVPLKPDGSPINVKKWKVEGGIASPAELPKDEEHLSRKERMVQKSIGGAKRLKESVGHKGLPDKVATTAIDHFLSDKVQGWGVDKTTGSLITNTATSLYEQSMNKKRDPEAYKKGTGFRTVAGALNSTFTSELNKKIKAKLDYDKMTPGQKRLADLAINTATGMEGALFNSFTDKHTVQSSGQKIYERVLKNAGDLIKNPGPTVERMAIQMAKSARNNMIVAAGLLALTEFIKSEPVQGLMHSGPVKKAEETLSNIGKSLEDTGSKLVETTSQIGRGADELEHEGIQTLIDGATGVVDTITTTTKKLVDTTLEVGREAEKEEREGIQAISDGLSWGFHKFGDGMRKIFGSGDDRRSDGHQYPATTYDGSEYPSNRPSSPVDYGTYWDKQNDKLYNNSSTNTTTSTTPPTSQPTTTTTPTSQPTPSARDSESVSERSKEFMLF